MQSLAGRGWGLEAFPWLGPAPNTTLPLVAENVAPVDGLSKFMFVVMDAPLLVTAAVQLSRFEVGFDTKNTVDAMDGVKDRFEIITMATLRLLFMKRIVPPFNSNIQSSAFQPCEILSIALVEEFLGTQPMFKSERCGSLRAALGRPFGSGLL
jgi:hypothetical protein